jgi:hypothetical protein
LEEFICYIWSVETIGRIGTRRKLSFRLGSVEKIKTLGQDPGVRGKK